MDKNELRNQIPEPLYEELVELFGKDKTEKIIQTERHDFRYLTMKILAERFRRKFGINFWIVLAIGFFIWLIYVFFL
ncbi:MAG: hypothetical protein KAT68_01350 [Bacteroidales bacterium]|nr:hypothetical protein [Bacteroidales bacterium]